MLSVREVTKKKKTKSEGYYKDKMGRNKKLQQKSEASKSRNNQQEGTGQDEQCSLDEQWQWQKHSCSAPFFFTFCSSFLLVFDLQC